MKAKDVFSALLSDLVLLDLPGRRPRARVYLWFAVLTVFAVWRSVGMIAGPIGFSIDSHATAAFSEAVNEVWCGKRSLVSDGHQIASRLVRQPSLMSTPVTTLLEQEAGSVKAYCDSVTTTFVNNENAIGTLDAVVLKLGGPSVTPVTVGRTLLGLRLAILLAFSGTVLLAGGSVVMCAAVFEIGRALCVLTMPWPFSVYSFIFIGPLLSIMLYTLLLVRDSRRVRWDQWILLAAVGLAAAFGANLRTSHFPAYVALFGLFLWLWRPATWAGAAAAVVLVCAGYLAGHWVFVTRRQPPVTAYNASYHVVAHPLVLSLAFPDNALARREGIEWQDYVGLTLAKRVDPSSIYLGPNYERALFRYYWSLWREHPRAMAGLYLWKLDEAGRGLNEAIVANTAPIWRSVELWLLLNDGFLRLWAMIALLIGSVLAYRRWRYVLAAVFGMLTLVALLLHIEMAIIRPDFVVSYHGFTLFYAATLGLVAVQVVVNAAARFAHPTDSDSTSVHDERGQLEER